MFHEQDHGLKAEHHLFATSHGKSPCDGIGGIIKREAANASLRAATSNQILSPYDLYSWAENNIKGVKMLFISSNDIESHTNNFDLVERYNTFKTIPGTRSYHCFIPYGNMLKLKKVSEDKSFDLHKFDMADEKESQYMVGKYVAFFMMRNGLLV